MSNELQPVFDYAKAHFPWITTAWLILSGVMTLSRLVFKPWSQAARERATLRLVDIAENGTAQECQDVLDRLHAGWYRASVFWLDTILSIKLPTHIEFHRLVTIAEDKRKSTQQ